MDRALIGLAVICLTGCGTLKIADPTDNRQPLKLAEMTQQSLEDEFAVENRYVQPMPDGRPGPRIGLALAGGGTKAGMFAHGVMHGLQQSGVLEHVHAISSTSGGGYAAYWYFSKKMEAARARKSHKNEFQFESIFSDCLPLWMIENDSGAYEANENDDKKEIRNAIVSAVRSAKREHIQSGAFRPEPICRFNTHQVEKAQGGDEDPYRWQAHIVRWPDLFNDELTVPTGSAQKSPLAKIAGYGLTAFFEIIPGWLGMESSTVDAYEAGIERTWGLNPLPRSASYAMKNSRPGEEQWEYSNSIGVHSTLRVDPEKNKWSTLRQLYDEDPKLPVWVINTIQGQKTSPPNAHGLYEITPFGHGSSRVGRFKGPLPFESITRGVRASAAFLDTQNIEMSLGTIVYKMAAGLLHAVQWGVHIPAKDPNTGELGEIRLSDGGAIENTGALSLIRRGVTDLIIADSAEDEEGLMTDVCNLHQLLEIEGLRLDFPALMNFGALCSQNRSGGRQQLAYNVSNWKSPVVEGFVEWPPTAAEPTRRIQVYLIKPAWDELQIQELFNRWTPYDTDCGTQPNQVNCWMPVYFYHDRSTTVGNRGDYMRFPQHGTVAATVNSSSYRIWAYRELGRNMALNLRYNEISRRVENVGIQCLQESLTAGMNGKRPIARPTDSKGRSLLPEKCKSLGV